MSFRLVAPYAPAGDQPGAISALVQGVREGKRAQTLLGVTGSGKTFTMANTIRALQRPTLIISHNKTLAAQLYGEFKAFFPHNAVEYFVSYYDYYQPEAYMPSTDVYIEKSLAINEEIKKLRLRTLSSLVAGRRDTLVVSSVSCIYGLSNPELFRDHVVSFSVGMDKSIERFVIDLNSLFYEKCARELQRGEYRIDELGQHVDLFLAYSDFAYRFYFAKGRIEEIQRIDPGSELQIGEESQVNLFPASIFVTNQGILEDVFKQIHLDLGTQIAHFESQDAKVEAQRLQERTELDLEMMRDIGYCSGIENYSRYFDEREVGQRPYCLLDYFPDDYLTIVDESHVTMPQVRAMWGGDRARKQHLVKHGFRLPSAMDNRPLSMKEFESIQGQTIYVSATPAKYELEASKGEVVEQIIRPTGLIDPQIEVHPTRHQIDDLIERIGERTAKDERVLVTTLTKRMAEELTDYLMKMGVKCRYIHSDVKTLDRVEILEQLRVGVFDVLIGVNLLREGIDLPEVSLVAILDADKEGFLRNVRSLIQVIGRAARHVNGRVVMYADRITPSMEVAINETNRRRSLQERHNKLKNITPQGLEKPKNALVRERVESAGYKRGEVKKEMVASDGVGDYYSVEGLTKIAAATKQRMEEAARSTDYLAAQQYHKELQEIKKRRTQIMKRTQRESKKYKKKKKKG